MQSTGFYRLESASPGREPILVALNSGPGKQLTGISSTATAQLNKRAFPTVGDNTGDDDDNPVELDKGLSFASQVDGSSELSMSL